MKVFEVLLTYCDYSFKSVNGLHEVGSPRERSGRKGDRYFVYEVFDCPAGWPAGRHLAAYETSSSALKPVCM